MKKLIVLLFLFCFIGFKTKAQTKFIMYQDTIKMRNEILKYIPLGTDTNTAKIIMRKNKFKCEWIYKSDFNSGQIRHKNINYLYCNREKTKGFITSRWQVAIVHKNGKITGIIVDFGLIGP